MCRVVCMGVSGPEMALELPSRVAGSNNSRHPCQNLPE